MAAPVKKGRSSSSGSTRSRTAGTVSGAMTASSCSCAEGFPATPFARASRRSSAGSPKASSPTSSSRAPHRVEAPCRHFGVCGGCRFQDLAYEAQVAEKERQVRDALVRIGRFADPPLEPIVPAASQFGYRNKLEYSFTSGEDGVDLGFHRAGRWDEVRRHRGVPPHDRSRQRDPARRAGLGARGAARALRPEGRHRATCATSSSARGGTRARRSSCSSPHRASASRRGYLVDVLRRFPEVRSIHWAINDTPAEQTNLPTALLWGDDAIEEEILGLRFRVRPSAFLQTNTEMAEQLYALAREYAGLTGTENVYDLYCGTGTIGLALAANARIGLGSRDLGGGGRLRDRERRAQRHREREVLRRERRADASRSFARRRAPPTSSSSTRRGRGWRARRCDGRARSVPPRIVYVSCNPTTLASDLQVLRDEYGYELERCRPVDMFPHTPHVESVSSLRSAR